MLILAMIGELGQMDQKHKEVISMKGMTMGMGKPPKVAKPKPVKTPKKGF